MNSSMDLDTCSSEPIHIPGAIQDHGYLLVVDESSHTIKQLSANFAGFLQLPAEAILGRSLDPYLSPESLQNLRQAHHLSDLRQVNPIPLTLCRDDASEQEFDGILHRSDGHLVIELEYSTRASAVSFFSFFHTVRPTSVSIQNAKTFEEAFQISCEQVKEITGFDRVLLYRFEEDWTGITLAEVREEHMDSYLGLRFPATDIPEQARRLYETNWLRLIADCNYVPSPLIGRTGEAPLDMSQSVLRSVSPVHLEYMRNMNTGASMSISIIKDDKLWGLISCHNLKPKYVDYQVRVACEFIGQMLSQQIAGIEGRSDFAYRRSLKTIHDTLVTDIETHGLTLNGLAHPEIADAWCRLTRADGGAIITQEGITRFGSAPDLDAIKDLTARLSEFRNLRVFTSDRLALQLGIDEWPDAAGLIAVPLTKSSGTYLLWFRKETIRAIHWAGRPGKTVIADGKGGELRLHPRQSFSAWEETRRGMAEPWQAAEIDAAVDLRNSILSEQLARTVTELAASNAELDAFATVASHDLKEPLRGIRNYATFIEEDNRSHLKAKSLKHLKQIATISEKLENLLQGLYTYSRVGRLHLAQTPTSLDSVLDDVLERLKPTLEEKHAIVLRTRALPTLRCDSVRTGEVFYNLISNALKYNDKPVPHIEVGWDQDEGGQTRFFVKDNGIGILEAQRKGVFQIFKRLHAPEEYGGGTGSGLAIVKRIIERHQGKIWIEANQPEGSIFYFNLGS